MKRNQWIGLVGLLLAITACDASVVTPPVQSGGCVTDLDCDDRLDCTFDQCNGSVGGERLCTHVPRDDRCDAGEACVPNTSPGSGCVTLARLWCSGRQEWEACIPDDACALGMGYCQNDVCTYDIRSCPDQDCMVSQGCDSITGLCAYAPQPDGTGCDRYGLACSTDACEAGTCVTVNDTCECTPDRACPLPEDLCQGEPTCEGGACVDHPVACPPIDVPCQQNTCDPQTGQCATGPVEDGLPCPDNQACTMNESCQNGMCVTEPLDCGQRPCLAPECIEPDGCVWTAVDEGMDCDDGDLCNGPDRCMAGTCLPFLAPVDCDDGDPCTADTCDPPTGLCHHAFVPDCCGNGVIEAGEQCDNGPDVVGCRGCRWSLIRLTGNGRAVAAIWDTDAAGVVAYEDGVDGDSSRLVLRRLDKDGNVDAPIEVPEAAAAADGFRPAMAPRGDGRILIATFEEDGLVLRILDTGLTERGRMVIEEELGVPTGEPLRLAVLGDQAFAAFEVGVRPDSFVKLIRVPLTGFGDDGPPPTPVIEGTVVGLLAGLSDLCVGDSGVLVTYWFKDMTRGNIPRADMYDSDLVRQWDFQAGLPNQLSPSMTRCTRLHQNMGCSGFALATDMLLWSPGGEPGEINVSTQFICEETGNVSNAEVVLTTSFPSIGPEGDPVLTTLSSSLAAAGDGYLYAAPFIARRPAPATDAVEARVLILDNKALAVGHPESPGPDMPSGVTRVDLIDIPGPGALMIGIAQGSSTSVTNTGQVWARVVPDPPESEAQ